MKTKRYFMRVIDGDKSLSWRLLPDGSSVIEGDLSPTEAWKQISLHYPNLSEIPDSENTIHTWFQITGKP
jgi:hypothetical protein